MRPLEILYEDNHLLAINKLAGLPTMGADAGKPTLVEAAKNYLKQKYNKPGNVYVGVVSRLDSPVTGVVLLARTSKAAARLTESFRQRQVGKRYWALVSPGQLTGAGTLEHYLLKDEAQRRMIVCSLEHPAASLAQLHYCWLASVGQHAWLEIELVTGRKHQIRVQLAAVRCPIVGDRRYGSSQPFPHGIALHARRLELLHPVRRQTLVIEAPLPAYWPRLPSVGKNEDRTMPPA
jgi:23S rRNA pseudouridine1911/1915/1917 synthase